MCLLPILTLAATGITLPLVAWILLRRAESVPRHRPQTALYHDRQGARPPGPGIPRQIWTYWHDADRPALIEACIGNWRRLNPDFRITVVCRDALHQYVAEQDLPSGFYQLMPQRQSDWLRLYLLNRHGGIWLDASIVLTRSLDWMIEAHAHSQADYVGFFLDIYTRRSEHPIIENWCMAAAPGSPFIGHWLRELTDSALSIGESAYLQVLARRGVRDEVLQGIEMPEYLIMHVAAQVLLWEAPDTYRLCLTRAEDSAFFYHDHSRWKWRRLFLRMLLRTAPDVPPALIKLRGKERRKMEFYIRHRLFRSTSLVGRYLVSLGREATEP